MRKLASFPLFGLFRGPGDALSVAVLRMAFGFSVFMWSLLQLSGGHLLEEFAGGGFHFKYSGFGWVPALPVSVAPAFFELLAVVSLLVLVGLFYRVSIITVTVISVYLFFIDRANYSDDFYALLLFGFLLCFVPANAALSLDVRFKRAARSDTIPGWCMQLLRFQLLAPFFFAGLARLNADWLTAMPVREVLQVIPRLPPASFFLDEPWLEYFISILIVAVDLLIVPGVLWRKTKWFALYLMLLFVLVRFLLLAEPTSLLFCVAPLLFLTDWWGNTKLLASESRAVYRSSYLNAKNKTSNRATSAAFVARVGQISEAMLSMPRESLPERPSWRSMWVVAYCLFQIVMPLRHYLYPGPVGWTKAGSEFSWLSLVHVDSGQTKFFVTDPNGSIEAKEIDPSKLLSPLHYRAMCGNPSMIVEFGHYIGDLRSRGKKSRIQVRAGAMTSLNGRPALMLIDPKVDLAANPPPAPRSVLLPLLK